MRFDAPYTLPGVLARASARYGDTPAIVTDGASLSFRQLADAAGTAAAAFTAAGIRKADRIGIWAPNSAEWIVAAIGVALCGAVLVPLNTRLKGKEAAFILRRSGARTLLTVGEFLGTRYPELLAGETLPALERTILFSGEHLRSGARGTAQSWTEFLARPRASPARGAAPVEVAPGDLADIMFTSGTTGAPKGVMSTHEQNVRVYITWADTVDLRTGDRYLAVNPFFHTFGYKAGWLASLIRGATIYPVAAFDASAVLRKIATERITVLPGPPTIYQSLLAHEARTSTDLSSLRLAVTGAASVPPILIRRMREELGFEHVVTAYGLTESTGTVTICPRGTPDEIVATRCGVPIAGVEVRCADDAGRTVAANEPGEVLVRGFNVMLGYLEDPAATAEAIDREGWLHTGDIGVLDEHGYLRITDRKKDMFIVGGFNCYPAEIERMLSEHPAIAQSAVIGVPDERLGEVGKAYVVLRPNASADAKEIIAWCRENMANYKVPRHVEIVASLPMNAAGKVQKFALRESPGG
jgi:acyl-CoA synthetase (AMP-forming)/AMP-acid ligase II